VSYTSARQFFDDLKANADPSRAADLTASYRFDIAGAGSWHVDVEQGNATVEESDRAAECSVATDEQTFLAVLNNEQSPIGAYMTGKVRVEGDMGLALRLRDLVG
jgi:putative sterol carrier protein